MTDTAQPLPLWIADQVRNDVIGTLFPCRLDSRLRGNDGEGRGDDGEGRGNDSEGSGNDIEGRGNDLAPCRNLSPLRSQ